MAQQSQTEKVLSRGLIFLLFLSSRSRSRSSATSERSRIRDREARLEDRKLEKRQSGGKLITVEKLETGQVRLSRVQIGEVVVG